VLGYLPVLSETKPGFKIATDDRLLPRWPIGRP